jgi:hypothetical protein
MADADHAHAFQLWSHAFNVCQNLYDDDEIEECINATEQDLNDPSMPLYHRIRYGLLLCGCHEDWYEANDALIRCEAIFQSVSTNHKDDPDEDVQESLQEIREMIDGVRGILDTQLREMEEDDEDDEEVDDVDMMDGEQAGEDVKMEEIIEDDNGVKRTPLLEGEIEDMKLVAAPEPSSDSRSGARLPMPTTPKLSADPSRLPEFKIEEQAATEPASELNLEKQAKLEPELNLDEQAEQVESTTLPSRWKRFRSSSAKVISKISNAFK